MRRKVKPKTNSTARMGPGLLGFAYAASALREKRRKDELANKLKKKGRRRVV